jgi:hypothetical protein
MFVKYYIQKIGSLLVAIFCIILGIATFGHSHQFDTSAIILLLIIAFFFRKDIDITSVIFLLVVGRLIEDIIFYTSKLNPLFIVSAYTLCAYCIYTFDRDKLRLVAASAFAIAITAQIYWYLTNYQAPEIYWQIYIINFSLLTRFFLVFRPAITQHLTKITAEHTQLDYKLQQLYGMPIVIELLNIIEYTIRHTTHFKPIYIYSAYPYLLQIIATYALYLVLDHAKQQWIKNTLSA